MLVLDKRKLRVLPGSKDSALLIEVLYDGSPVANVKVNGSKPLLSLSIDIMPAYAESELIVRSLLRCSQIEMEQVRSADSWEVVTSNNYLKSEAKAIGGILNSDSIFFNARSRSSDLKYIKQKIIDRIASATIEGRGYCLNLEDLNLTDLMNEYNDIAWGYTNWARNIDANNDELRILSEFVTGNVLEIGAGSGRLTRHILPLALTLTATDYVESIINQLKMSLSHPNLKIVCDDILATQLTTEFFDTVIFLENGLGSFITRSLRLSAIENTIKLIKPGGRLILGIRSMLNSPCEHVMFASQYPQIIGVYHTFSIQEVTELVGTKVKLIEARAGESRPAGGFANFLVFERRP